jgi:hypothetical protein
MGGRLRKAASVPFFRQSHPHFTARDGVLIARFSDVEHKSVIDLRADLDYFVAIAT